MNSKEDYFPRLDPGEPMLARKRFPSCQMEANVYQAAKNLLPPLDPPQPTPLDPTQPPAEIEISKWIDRRFCGVAVKKNPDILNFNRRTDASKDSGLETREQQTA